MPEGPQGCGGPEGTGFWVSPSTLRLWGVECITPGPEGGGAWRMRMVHIPPTDERSQDYVYRIRKTNFLFEKEIKTFFKGTFKISIWFT